MYSDNSMRIFNIFGFISSQSFSIISMISSILLAASSGIIVKKMFCRTKPLTDETICWNFKNLRLKSLISIFYLGNDFCYFFIRHKMIPQIRKNLLLSSSIIWFQLMKDVNLHQALCWIFHKSVHDAHYSLL